MRCFDRYMRCFDHYARCFEHTVNNDEYTLPISSHFPGSDINFHKSRSTEKHLSSTWRTRDVIITELNFCKLFQL